MTAIPLVVGNVVYLQDMESNVYAIDRGSGAVIWRHDYGMPTAGPNGVAAGYGLIFGATGLDAGGFALDAATGDEIWRVKLFANHGEFTFMQPIVYDNVVYLATSPSAYIGGTRGILFALDAESGAVLWQWDTTTDNLWGSARLNAGGGVWRPPSVDASVINLPLIYSATSFNVDLATATGEMIALAAVDGSVRWRTSVDTFFAAGATVANDVVFGAGLDGIVREFAAATGTEIWSYQAGAGINAPPAIAGNMLLVPAGGPLVSARSSPSSTQSELIAFRHGEEAAATATPLP